MRDKKLELDSAVFSPLSRAVAAGPVSPVSTGPLFPLPWRAWRRQSSAIAQRTPTYGPQVHT